MVIFTIGNLASALASSFNIAAFNLGNAIGAWLGGMMISHGPGLGAVSWVTALLPLFGLLVALCSVRLDIQPSRRIAIVTCTETLL